MVIFTALVAFGAEPFLFPPFDGAFPLVAGVDHRGPMAGSDGRRLSWQGRWVAGRSAHAGLDFGLPWGTPILAAADGIVVSAGEQGPTRCGPRIVDVDRRIVVRHTVGGTAYTTAYLHLSDVGVEVGQPVGVGELLGRSGSSGCASKPHLHFQVERAGVPVDPMGWQGPFQDPMSSDRLWRVAPRGRKKGVRSSMPRDGG